MATLNFIDLNSIQTSGNCDWKSPSGKRRHQIDIGGVSDGAWDVKVNFGAGLRVIGTISGAAAGRLPFVIDANVRDFALDVTSAPTGGTYSVSYVYDPS